MTSMPRRVPSASSFHDALVWTIGHHSRGRLTFVNDTLIGNHNFPADYVEKLEALSASKAGTIKTQRGQKVKVTHLKVPIPYAPVLKSDFLCTQILVVGGLVKMAETQSFNQLPSGWRLDSKKTPTVGLYRVVGFAFRNQRIGYNNARAELTWQPMIWKDGMAPANPNLITVNGTTHVDPVYVRSLIENKDPLVKSLRPVPGIWMLTSEGAAKALALIQEKGTPGCSRTGQWFDQNVGPQEMEKLYVNLSRRLPRSATLRKIKGHVHTKISKMVELDSFGANLAAGQPPSLNQISHFIYRSAVSDLVADGREPVSRALHGANTPRERGGEHLILNAEELGQPVWLSTTAIEDEPGGPVVDVVGRSLEIDLMEQDAVRSGLADIEKAVRAFKPKAGDRYVAVLRSQIEGKTISEIGEQENVGYDRASTLINDARNVARKSALCGTLALKALEYILEEPSSSLEDLQEDLGLHQFPVPGVPQARQEQAQLDLLLKAVGYLRRTNRIEAQIEPRSGMECFQAAPDAPTWLTEHKEERLFFIH